jgi:hypothetical protein
VRIRCLNPLLELKARGYAIELFDPKQAESYALVVYAKSYDEASYDSAIALQKHGTCIVFDLCDNHFYNPKRLSYWREAGERLRRMMSIADALVASTETLREVMRVELSAPRPITVIGDAVETNIQGVVTPRWQRRWGQWQLVRLLHQLAADKHQGVVPLVWFGNHGSPYADGGMLDLLKVRALLERMHRRYPLSLTVISNSRAKYNQAIRPWKIPTRYLPWRPDTFLPALRAHAIAILPILDNPFTRCKSNNRLALSLHTGLAVVADSIPSYQAFAHVCRLDNWETGLAGYLTDLAARQADVQAGQALIAKEYSLGSIADQWQNLFHMLLTSTGCR